MAVYAHYALQKLGVLPSEFSAMDVNERAFVIASIDRRIDEEKRLREELDEKLGRR